MATPYALLTLFRDEERTLQMVIDAIDAQVVRPSQWLLLDDDSSDDSSRIAVDYTSSSRFASYMRLSPSSNEPYLRISRGIAEGWNGFVNRVRPSTPPYWGVLDADISVEPSYFATLASHLDSHSRVAATSGDLLLSTPDGDLLEDTSPPRPRGGARLMRVEALNEIGGPPVVPSWDAAIDVKFELHGWTVDRNRQVRGRHLRPTNTRFGSSEGRRLSGEGGYVLRYSSFAVPVVAALVAVEAGEFRCYIAFIRGFFGGWLKDLPRIEDIELSQYYRTMGRRYVSRKLHSLLNRLGSAARVRTP